MSIKIPKKFLGAINYRCIFPIEIRKNILNSSSPIAISSEHELSTALGQFSFAVGSISSRRGQTEGFKYTPTGAPSNSPSNKGSEV